MREKILGQNIDRLNVSCKAIELMKNNNIVDIRQLCTKNKTFLKNLGLETDEVNKLEVELQLMGLDLKHNY